MNGKKLSAALTALPEDMVEEAMESGHGGRSFSWLRLAFCAVLVLGLFVGFWPTQPEIVTAPGLLTVTVYAMDEKSETGYVSIPLSEGINVSSALYTPLGLSIWPGIPVELHVDSQSQQIRFDVTVSSGHYLEMSNGAVGYLGNAFSCTNESIIYWDITLEDYETGNIAKSDYDNVYTYIIIYEEEYIVGYAIIRLDRLYGKEFVELNPEFSDYYEDDDPVQAYHTIVIKSVQFPKVNNEYQNISLEYVEKCFADIMD